MSLGEAAGKDEARPVSPPLLATSSYHVKGELEETCEGPIGVPGD